MSLGYKFTWKSKRQEKKFRRNYRNIYLNINCIQTFSSQKFGIGIVCKLILLITPQGVSICPIG